MAPSRRRRLFFTVLVATLLPFAFACNDLLGISDYSRAECSGGGLCGEAGADANAEDRRVPDAGADVVLVDASGTKPVRWPNFKMPNYVQDGGPTENIATYGPTADGFVDSVSDRTWFESPVDAGIGGTVTYAQAEARCAALAPAGTWRLPGRIELVSLLDHSRGSNDPKINVLFVSTQAIEYWTTSEVRPDNAPRRHWTVDFSEGGLKQKALDGQAGVRCIKNQ
jgi:hypothetical protein